MKITLLGLLLTGSVLAQTAPGLTPQSRLACQCVPDGSQDLVVEIPSWNRNAVKE